MSKSMSNEPHLNESTNNVCSLHETGVMIAWQNSTDNGTVLAFRIAAFGAIRRAAEVARQFDHDAEVLRQRCHAVVDGKYSGDVALLNRYQSESKIDAAIVRRAIRAAIGSDKA
jgi:hypothetical protein